MRTIFARVGLNGESWDPQSDSFGSNELAESAIPLLKLLNPIFGMNEHSPFLLIFG